MFQRFEKSKKRSRSVMVCLITGSVIGMGLGILFGFSFGNIAYMFIGVMLGTLMGLAIGESNKAFKDLPYA